MTLRTTLPALYTAQGYTVREGAGSGNLAACMSLWRGNLCYDTGAGTPWADLAVFERLARTFTPRAIFGIGNGFGWSTVALRVLWPAAALVVLDAEIEGADNAEGTRLTQRILDGLGGGEVVRGASPEMTVSALCVLGVRPSLVFIDGLHTDAQQIVDFDTVRPFLAAEHIVFFHDVVLCGVQKSWNAIAMLYGARAKILNTPTGMGCVWTNNVGDNLE